MKGISMRVSIYGAVHFLVDFSCAFLMFRNVSASGDFSACLLVYNFFAFAMQMPLGLIADKLNRNAALAGAGCLLTALACTVSLPLPAAIAAGLGNGLFHVGGGLEVLNHSGDKSGPLGVFVSPGAFGIYFGTALGKGGALPTPAVIAALVAAAAAILFAHRLCGGAKLDNPPPSLPLLRGGGMLAVCCLFLVVVLRSYTGMTLHFPWKADWGLPLITAVVLGKALGGYIADHIGMRRAAAASLGLCAAAFLLGGYPLFGIAAVLLFNMTMPMTLFLLSRRFPRARGFAFGVLTFALFLGFLPVYLGAPPVFSGMAGYALIALASLALLYPGLRAHA